MEKGLMQIYNQVVVIKLWYYCGNQIHVIKWKLNSSFWFLAYKRLMQMQIPESNYERCFAYNSGLKIRRHAQTQNNMHNQTSGVSGSFQRLLWRKTVRRNSRPPLVSFEKCVNGSRPLACGVSVCMCVCLEMCAQRFLLKLHSLSCSK